VRLRWTEGARADLLAIVAYIAEERPAAARKMAARITASIRAAAEHPFIGRAVPELGVDSIRERIVPPYRVVYQVRREDLIVLAVVHSSREALREPEEDDAE
jgi:addiction module RelE/StbE family toxin